MATCTFFVVCLVFTAVAMTTVDSAILRPYEVKRAEELMEDFTHALDTDIEDLRFDDRSLGIPKIRRTNPYSKSTIANVWPWLVRHDKRNSELINSLLGLPRIMKVVG